MNKYKLIIPIVLTFIIISLLPVSIASTGTYVIVENGLPAGTQWEYINNGINYTTTNNVVWTNGIDIFYPVYDYTMSVHLVGNTYYLNYTQGNAQGFTIQKLIPYGVITLLIIAPIAIAVVIKRRNNEE